MLFEILLIIPLCPMIRIIIQVPQKLTIRFFSICEFNSFHVRLLFISNESLIGNSFRIQCFSVSGLQCVSVSNSELAASGFTSEIANRQSYVANLFDPASFHHFSLCGAAACQTRAGTKRFTIDDLRCMICDLLELGCRAWYQEIFRNF